MNMEQIAIRLVEQSPAVGATVFLVILFLRHIRTEREQQNIFFRQIHEDNLTAREQTRDAIEKNSATIIESVRVTARNTETLDRLSRAIETCSLKEIHHP